MTWSYNSATYWECVFTVAEPFSVISFWNVWYTWQCGDRSIPRSNYQYLVIPLLYITIITYMAGHPNIAYPLLLLLLLIVTAVGIAMVMILHNRNVCLFCGHNLSKFAPGASSLVPFNDYFLLFTTNPFPSQHTIGNTVIFGRTLFYGRWGCHYVTWCVSQFRVWDRTRHFIWFCK